MPGGITTTARLRSGRLRRLLGLGSLSNLTQLLLDNNQLSGCVPSSLEDQLDRRDSDLGDLSFC